MTEKNDTISSKESIEALTEKLGGPFDSRRDFLKKTTAMSAAGLGLSMGTGTVAASGQPAALTPKKKFEKFGDGKFILLENPEGGKFPQTRPVACGGSKEEYHVYQIFYLSEDADAAARESYLLVPTGTDVETAQVYKFAGEPAPCEGDEKGKFEFLKVAYEPVDLEDEDDDEEKEVDGATVTFRNQTYGGSKVTVQETFLPEEGFMAIHDLSLVADGLNPVDSVIGASELLDAGEHEDVEVPLFESVPGAEFNQDELQSTQALIAMPHKSTNDNETYDFVQSGGEKDGPFTRGGAAVVDIAFVVVE
ncbi:twin-arginine translocation signal domain-containing protein [Halorussus sp. MSC15.2]|nr:twin-arginine translocation signal domain-containing protein [Halorussus sp. MSC15.2]